MKSVIRQAVCIPVKDSTSRHSTTNGSLYGSGETAIILSNMDTNDQTEWDAVVEALVADDRMIVTYDYLQQQDDQSPVLEDVIAFVCAAGAKTVILVGASRGGVASINVAANTKDNHCILGVVALSAPIEYEGIVFYGKEELSRIKIPKLLINSEHDDGASDTREMFQLFDEPKELVFYPGDAHGTQLFTREHQAIITELQDFIAVATGGM
ncbi:MAG: alpha/beta hydrolase [Desulfuromonas sp.]|nr:MAG: alpha/beta hydrolase [Desulfuromonas sp.]